MCKLVVLTRHHHPAAQALTAQWVLQKVHLGLWSGASLSILMAPLPTLLSSASRSKASTPRCAPGLAYQNNLNHGRRCRHLSADMSRLGARRIMWCNHAAATVCLALGHSQEAVQLPMMLAAP